MPDEYCQCAFVTVRRAWKRFKKQTGIMKLKDCLWLIIGGGIALFTLIVWFSYTGNNKSNLDSLFAGLAFAGLISTILLQRQELQDTRKEMKGQTEQFRLQVRASAAQMLTVSLPEHIRMMQSILAKVSEGEKDPWNEQVTETPSVEIERVRRKWKDLLSDIYKLFEGTAELDPPTRKAEKDPNILEDPTWEESLHRDIGQFCYLLDLLEPWAKFAHIWVENVCASCLSLEEKSLYVHYLLGALSRTERCVLLLCLLRQKRIQWQTPDNYSMAPDTHELVNIYSLGVGYTIQQRNETDSVMYAVSCILPAWVYGEKESAATMVKRAKEEYEVIVAKRQKSVSESAEAGS